MLIGALAVGAWWIARQERRPNGSERADAQASRRVVAVLPFKNVSADAAQNYFSAGMTEEIRGQLSKLSALRLLSRSAVERYSETECDGWLRSLALAAWSREACDLTSSACALPSN